MSGTLSRRELLASAAGGGLAASRRPNVLFVMTDQQSARAMSAAGNPYLQTPHMDWLARSGTRFQNSYCASPVCSPARASLVTGLMPSQVGIDYNGAATLPADIPVMGEIFRAAGYQTAWSGKWHLPEGYPGLPRSGAPRPGSGQARGFEVLPLQAAEPRKAIHWGDFADQPAVEAAIAFLRRKHEQPFLLGVSLHNPHDICHYVMDSLPPDHPGAAIRKHAREAEYPPLPANFPADPEEPELIRLCRERKVYGPENTFTKGWDERMWRSYLYAYYRMTERVDGLIGRLLGALRQTGRQDNTLIAFTADHGEGMAAHHWVVKLMLWEEPATVPLILSWKGRIPAGRVDRECLASGIDLLPTLCDYAGVQLPRPVAGESLRRPRREFVVTELAPDPKRRELSGRMVRTRRYKYITFSCGANPELFYDLNNDPGERRNLARDPGLRREIERHRGLLEDWRRRLPG